MLGHDDRPVALGYEPVQQSCDASPDKPGERGDVTKQRDQRYDQRDDRRGREGVESIGIPASLVPVRSGRSLLEECVNLDPSPLYEVVVRNDDAEDRSEEHT